MVAIYAALIAVTLAVPGLQPKGMAVADFQRLAATLGVWVLFVLVSELSPVLEANEPRQEE